MTLNEFALLSPEEQATVTWNHGAFIAVGDMGHMKVLLYQLNSYYVEVYYNCELSKIERFNCFDSTDQLGPYLAAIDLSDLMPLLRSADGAPAAAPRNQSRVWRMLYKLFPLTVVTCSFILAFSSKPHLYL